VLQLRKKVELAKKLFFKSPFFANQIWDNRVNKKAQNSNHYMKNIVDRFNDYQIENVAVEDEPENAQSKVERRKNGKISFN
jgi:hypothetical protein